MRCSLRLEAWAAGFNIGSRLEVPGKREPMIREQQQHNNSNNNNNN